MSVLPADSSKWEWPAGPVVRTPDLPIVPDIEELARRKQADAREQWQQDREARFAEQIYDDLHVLDDAVAVLADRSKAVATARKYKLHWARFVKFAAAKVLDDGYGMRALPASPELTAYYLLTELTRGQRYSTIKQITAAISDAHATNHMPDHCSSLIARAALRLARQHDGKFAKAELIDEDSEQTKSNGKANGQDSQHKEASDGDEGTQSGRGRILEVAPDDHEGQIGQLRGQSGVKTEGYVQAHRGCFRSRAISANLPLSH
jgi:hypothetical protein